MAQSWSGLRKTLEQDLLCPALRGRVQYFLTHYHGAPDDYGRFCVRVDGREHVMANPYSYYVKGYAGEEFRLKEERNIPEREWTDKGMLHETENQAVEDEVERQAIADGVFEIWFVTRAIRFYTQSPIGDSLHSEDPLVRLFAVLDRRVGRRTLERLALAVEAQPEWLQYFYRLRLEAEGIPYADHDSL